MKTYLLVAVITLFTVAANAQTATKYCELDVFMPNFNNYTAKVKFNDKPKFEFVKDNTGNKMKFASEMDALNYLFKEGWQLVTCYHNRSDETHFFLKK